MYNTTTTLELERAVNITGEGYRDRFGFALAVLDFNLDGVDDLVVSSGNNHTLFVLSCFILCSLGLLSLMFPFCAFFCSLFCVLFVSFLFPFCVISVATPVTCSHPDDHSLRVLFQRGTTISTCQCRAVHRTRTTTNPPFNCTDECTCC
jgi:hypothetical protein